MEWCPRCEKPKTSSYLQISQLSKIETIFWLDIFAGILAIPLVFTGRKGILTNPWLVDDYEKSGSSTRIHPHGSSQKSLLLLATFLIPLASCITVCAISLCINRIPGAKCEVKIFRGNFLECFVCCKGFEKVFKLKSLELIGRSIGRFSWVDLFPKGYDLWLFEWQISSRPFSHKTALIQV